MEKESVVRLVDERNSWVQFNNQAALCFTYLEQG